MSHDKHTDVINQLTDLGFSPHEAAIYISVLRHGEASAGMVLDDVKLHREQVYRALKRLTDNGFLTHYTKRKRGYYTTVDPEILVRRMKTQVDIAESLQPYLNSLRHKKAQTITVHEGPEAYIYLFEDIIRTLSHDNEYLVISTLGERFYNATKDFYPRYAQIMQRRNISIRLIGYELEDYKNQFTIQRLIKVRVIGENYGAPVATVIYGSKVAIEVHDSDNLAIIFIENDNIARAYKDTFETLWRLGKDLTPSK